MGISSKSALGASYKYTDETVAGMGAIKGAPATIQSITPIEGGNRVTFAWEDNEGTTHTEPMDVADGAIGPKGDKGDSGSTVTYTQTLQSGTKIGEITIDGTTTNILAPSGGSGGSSALSELTDVDLSTLSDGDVLIYDNTNSKWVNESPEEGALVTAVLSKDTMPTAGVEYEDIVVLYIGTTSANYTKGHSYLCVENSGSYSWTDITPSGGSSTLSNLTDVDLEYLSDGEILVYDAQKGKWINFTPNIPHSEEKQFEVTTSGWTADTTSQSGTTLYKKALLTEYTIENVLSVNIGASDTTLPTTAQQTAYDLVQYATLDGNGIIYLYASAIPTDSFFIKVIAEYSSGR